jgi:hypothetical protein
VPGFANATETAPNRAENIDHVCELLACQEFLRASSGGIFARSNSLVVYNLDAKNASKNRRMSMRT